MIQLRDYQTAAIEDVRTELRAGHRRVCLVMPTGSGKTYTAASLVAGAINKGKRVLWLAHRTELVDQAIASLETVGVKCGAVAASSGHPSRGFAPCQVASIQTLIARKHYPEADVIVSDECHHMVAKEFRAVLDQYKTQPIIGLTATPERGDGRGLGEVFDAIVVGTTVSHLVSTGSLVHAELIAPSLELRSGEIAMHPVAAYQQYAAGRQTIVFTNCVKAAIDQCAAFDAAGIKACYVTGAMSAQSRAVALNGFKSGKYQVLCNVMVLTEGFDAPTTSACILARGVGTTGLYLQMVGRVLRPAPGKTDAVIIDLHGASRNHGHPEDAYTYSLDGQGVRSGADPIEREFSSCKVCGCPLGDEDIACSDCGVVRDTIKPPRVVESPMVKFARKRAEGPEERWATLQRWGREARAKGYKPGWILGRAKAVYGTAPSWSEVQRAYAGAAERSTPCAACLRNGDGDKCALTKDHHAA
jgi:superfamily II DNA or RNA helicase